MSNKKTIFLAMIFFGLFGMAKASYAADFYVAQAAAGSGNGTSCANAYVYTWFNNSGNWANPK
ncbi:MAG: hypothetical protein P4L58_02895, partial [Candidatus Pacebacteria bacterium]|nr:hypothetical protein [Candidatus Paceibacterota bacterium]